MEKEVILNVKGQKFAMRRSVLCQYSAYFQAMFSENFREHDQQEITLNNIDCKSMKFILDYMKHGRIDDIVDQSEHSLDFAGNLAEAANMLQIVQISEVVKSTLERQNITPNNCFEIMAIAENANYTKLLHICAHFALSSFYDMKPEFVPTVQGLVWYLSHNQLDVTNERDVFIFGLNWMSQFKSIVGPSDLLLFLGCLDIKRITTEDLLHIKIQMKGFEDKFFFQVIDFLIELSYSGSISTDQIIARKTALKEKYTKTIYDEVLNLVKDSKSRKLELNLVFAMENDRFSSFDGTHGILRQQGSRIVNFSVDELSKLNQQPHLILYKLTNAGAELWLETNFPRQIVSSRHSYYSWNIAAWGKKKMLLVISRKTSHDFNEDIPICKTIIRVYDVLKEEWMDYDTLRTEGMCFRLAVVGDTMTIISQYKRNIIYDLRKKTHKVITPLPLEMRNGSSLIRRIVPNIPSSCVHNNEIYIGNYAGVYKYEEAMDKWIQVLVFSESDDYRITDMFSHDGCIFFVTRFDREVFKYNPEEDELNFVCSLPESDLNDFRRKCCHFGDKLGFLTSTQCKTRSFFSGTKIKRNNIYLEKYNAQKNKFEKTLCLKNSTLDVDSDTDTVRLALGAPPSVMENFSGYLQRYLKGYSDVQHHQLDNKREKTKK